MKDLTELLDELREFQDLADAGNEVAAHVVAWFDSESDRASVAGTWPTETADVRRLWFDATTTARLYFGARLLRWLLDHPGQEPTHFMYALSITFEDLS